MVEVRLSRVKLDLGTTPAVLLQETEGKHRSLVIFIGPNEAASIAQAMRGIESPRPLTHDLMTTVLEGLGARLTRVVVTELRDSTYYAELQLKAGQKDVSISCRPSDGIALAARTHSPLYVADDVMEAEGIVVAPADADLSDLAEPEELVAEFSEFLDTIRPEDFSS